MTRSATMTIAVGLAIIAAACEPPTSPTDVGVTPDFGVLPPGAVIFEAQGTHGMLDAISCNQGVCELDISGAGTANIMGRFTWTSRIVEDLTATPCVTAPAILTLTGATGTIVITDSEGAVCPIPGDQGFGFISSTWEVTGGTGEFSGISGSGTTRGPTAGGGPVVHLSGVVSY